MSKKIQINLSSDLQRKLVEIAMREEVYCNTDWNLVHRAFEYGFSKNILDDGWFEEMFPGCEWKGSWDASSGDVWEKGIAYWTNDKTRMHTWQVVRYCLNYDIAALVHVMWWGSAAIQDIISELSSSEAVKHMPL